MAVREVEGSTMNVNPLLMVDNEGIGISLLNTRVYVRDAAVAVCGKNWFMQ